MSPKDFPPPKVLYSNTEGPDFLKGGMDSALREESQHLPFRTCQKGNPIPVKPNWANIYAKLKLLTLASSAVMR